MRNWIILGAVALAVTAAVSTPAGARGGPRGVGEPLGLGERAFVDEDGDGINDVAALRHELGGPGLFAGMFSTKLTDAQEAELQAKIEALKADGATMAEVAAAIRETLTGLGIDVPDYADHVVARLGTKLTDAQEAELQALVDGLEADGADVDAIRTAVDAKLAEYGVDTAGLSRRGRHGEFGAVGRFSGQLTDAQEAELAALLVELEAGDATRADIRAALDAKLTEYGVTLPQPGDFMVDRLGNLLTDAQEVELQALIDAMRSDGATQAEIRTAVDGKLDEYGVDAPRPAGGPRGGGRDARRPGPGPGRGRR